ncbi:hypothetical protein BO70DRAFT_393601 [Aspergillus heteromorphus CBS 117.55]|uniref:Uncharacterized protein n=1 Tax=Aspergillus heteromorphus CBS 117.55 TaxID=1448321 RepID=A0A317WUV1_9EURO|nr:uncharacterized protein BO70DRAFT_393601 [Aspergillus heteromorphus CBS 117.55]PWY89082.1 hypothetical protein BO70DRAFT_393601 [Aspergillus heteromorphus CBS 117.55]
MPAVSDILGLTPLDHLPAKLFLPYILYFDHPDPQLAINTLQSSIGKVISQLPWLAGDVIMHSVPDGPKDRMHIAAPRVPLSEVPILQVKHFDRDEDIRSHPVQSYLHLPTICPASEQRPVLRFQANIEASPENIIVTSWGNLEVFSLDFGPGLGRIEDFEPGLALVPGGCILLPSRPVSNGSTAPWEVCITLKKGDSQTLAQDSLLSRILA